MNNFFQTLMGRKFYEGDVPRITKALEKIAEELERANNMKESDLAKDIMEKIEKSHGKDDIYDLAKAHRCFNSNPPILCQMCSKSVTKHSKYCKDHKEEYYGK